MRSEEGRLARSGAYRFAKVVGNIVGSANVRDCKSECLDILMTSLALYLIRVASARGL